jgi:phosphomannomutase
LLEIVSRSPDANAVLQALPTSQSTPELNVACVEGEPHRVTAELMKLAQTQGLPSSEHQPVLCDIDGVRIDWADGFGLVRASNTTPVLVLRFEGQTPQALARIESDMMALLRQVKPDAQVQEAAH